MIIAKNWGYENILVNNELYCGKILTVIPNKMACSIHYHKQKTETFYILQGVLILEIYSLQSFAPRFNGDLLTWTSTREMCVGETVTLLPLTPHRFYVENKEICEFLEVSTHDDSSDSFRLRDSGLAPLDDDEIRRQVKEINSRLHTIENLV